MGKSVIALNETKTRQAGNWAKSQGRGMSVLHCSTLAELQALPTETYSRFLIGNKTGVTPEQFGFLDGGLGASARGRERSSY